MQNEIKQKLQKNMVDNKRIRPIKESKLSS